ncbi:alpha-L-rhamnosidase [Persicitalea jodogahamensis]|uniref:alpha-L-rhamnosidase n=1 Tax=Persicitalea jodogahamensis TaxID=402147 RepID=A0A8J3D805_9BACT|nr:alpha-L-rhamnosidase [Persicitalea jodogahamensis]GHB65847.1 alfa-L-rhamnosidase [Persicitalea jodogahamensis]
MKTLRYFVAALLLLTFGLNRGSAQNLVANYLRTEYKVSPVTDVVAPRLSWELTSPERNQIQSAYQILVASSPEKLTEPSADLWNSEKVNSRATAQVVYAGKTLTSRQICYWKVRSWDKAGQPGAWSEVAHWEMGLLDKNEWRAQWIGLDPDTLGKGKIYQLPPAPYLRKEIKVKPGFRKARLYVTALGLYEFSLNGTKTGNDFLTPGWTDYDRRVYYQTYDVTSQIKSGTNVLTSQLSYGWYAGYLGYALLVKNPVVRAFYGKVPLLKAQLEVEYPDGHTETFATDKNWKASFGALLESDLMHGETYDARLEWPGWQKSGFDDRKWQKAEVYPDRPGRLVQTYPAPPVQITGTLTVQSQTRRPDGSYILDMGQNFAGTIRLRVQGKAGDTIRLRYGEKLFPDGQLMTENLRMARATDTYILKGDKNGEEWMPKFTYKGFQYIEISGLRAAPAPETIEGLVIGSELPRVGTFETDNAMVNQLYSNIEWTQRSNYIDIPTDCPQRDERMGWTADAHVYVKSATFNRDVSAFFTKWTVDLNDAQYENGAYPLYAPRPNLRKTDTYSPGWMEAGIICPYQVYRSYGDTRLIREGWVNMGHFMDFLEKRSNGTYFFTEATFKDLSPKGGFGDWLSFGKKTPPDMLASFYFAYCADMMAEMAGAIGESDDQKRFQEMGQKVRKALLDHYQASNGRFKTDTLPYGDGAGYVDGKLGFMAHTQTAYANAIYMDIVPPKSMPQMGKYLAELLRQNDGKLATGFLGTKPLLPALSATGHSGLAYDLFLSTEFPSWGFEVANGSTTIWERWDSYTKEDGFRYNAAMNSFNHYSFGAVCEWMFGNAAGIQELAPGYRHFRIRPEIDPKSGSDRINRLRAGYHSVSGPILSAWQKTSDGILMNVSVPVNTTAEVFVPADSAGQVVVDGQEALASPDIRVESQANGYLVLFVGSGNYEIVSKR